jgi:hypothetical protein
MNVNFGLFPPLASTPSRGPNGERLRGNAKTLAKRRALTARALLDLDTWTRRAAAPDLQPQPHTQVMVQTAPQGTPSPPSSGGEGWGEGGVRQEVDSR